MPDGDLDEAVRRADPDRWLASRFIADRAARADVIALYAYDADLARAARVASSPLVAEMRLTWWREVLDDIFLGRAVGSHPVFGALATCVRRRGLPREPLEAMIDARIATLAGPRFEPTEAIGWAEDVGGSATILASRVLDPDSPGEPARLAGRAWGLALLIRGGWSTREDLADGLARALREASEASREVGHAAFPALACATLARADLRGRRPSELAKRLALVWAVGRGRL